MAGSEMFIGGWDGGAVAGGNDEVSWSGTELVFSSSAATLEVVEGSEGGGTFAGISPLGVGVYSVVRWGAI
jgi:hypothetical protein